MIDYYKVLSLLPNATISEINEAYIYMRHLLSDKIQENDESALEQLKLLDEAYEILGDPDRRIAYDQSRRGKIKEGAIVPTKSLPETKITPFDSELILEHICPFCEVSNPLHAVICNNCQKQIARPCPNCGQLNALTNKQCHRCGTLIHQYDQQRLTDGLAVERGTKLERQETDERSNAFERTHKERAALGIVFWIIVGLGCIGLPLIVAIVSHFLE